MEYNDKTYICSSKSIIRCSLGKILNKITKDFKVEIGQTFKDEKRYLTKLFKNGNKKVRSNWDGGGKKFRDEIMLNYLINS